MKSPHRCPACKNPLTVIKEDSTTLIYCAVGRCPSEMASDGIKGFESDGVLAKRLIDKLNDVRDWENL